MKRLATLLILLSVLFCAFFCCAATRDTDSDQQTSPQTPVWVRITQEETWLYKNSTANQSDRLFLLAYTYYAKVLESTQNGFYYVELMENSSGFVKIYGYVKQSEVTPQETAPLTPTYPTVFITVKQSNIILFNSPSSSAASVCAVYEGQTLYYFGAYPAADKNWYFVRFGQNLCYVDAEGVSAPAIALHPTPMPVPPEETPKEETPPVLQPTEQPTEEDGGFSKLQIAIISLVALSALVVVVILFLPAKSKKQKYQTYDQPYDVTPFQSNNSITEPKPRYFDDFL